MVRPVTTPLPLIVAVAVASVPVPPGAENVTTGVT